MSLHKVFNELKDSNLYIHVNDNFIENKSMSNINSDEYIGLIGSNLVDIKPIIESLVEEGCSDVEFYYSTLNKFNKKILDGIISFIFNKHGYEPKIIKNTKKNTIISIVISSHDLNEDYIKENIKKYDLYENIHREEEFVESDNEDNIDLNCITCDKDKSDEDESEEDESEEDESEQDESEQDDSKEDDSKEESDEEESKEESDEEESEQQESDEEDGNEEDNEEDSDEEESEQQESDEEESDEEESDEEESEQEESDEEESDEEESEEESVEDDIENNDN